ncbi:TetR/AcrR family transcriptional regulator [Gordonia sp. NPDC003376]
MQYSSSDSRVDSIVKAAIRILDEGGVDALNMRQLAAEVGLRPMTLYHHVPNKTVLLTLAITEVGRRITWGTYTGTPRERLIAQAVDVYVKLSAVDWMPAVLRAGAPTGAPPLDQTEVFVTTAAELGLDDAAAFGLWCTIWHVVGAEVRWSPTALRELGEQIRRPTIDPELVRLYPSVTRLIANLDELTTDYHIEPYLEALIDGVLARR